jgi:hypothetical protein
MLLVIHLVTSFWLTRCDERQLEKWPAVHFCTSAAMLGKASPFDQSRNLTHAEIARFMTTNFHSAIAMGYELSNSRILKKINIDRVVCIRIYK